MNTSTPRSTEDLDALRVRVAELCEWTSRQEPSPMDAQLLLTFYKRPDGKEQAEPWPDFPRDLDAILAEVRKLPDDKHILYVAALARVVYADYAKVGSGQFTKFQLITAAASQHCRAFVATMEGTK